MKKLSALAIIAAMGIAGSTVLPVQAANVSTNMIYEQLKLKGYVVFGGELICPELTPPPADVPGDGDNGSNEETGGDNADGDDGNNGEGNGSSGDDGNTGSGGDDGNSGGNTGGSGDEGNSGGNNGGSGDDGNTGGDNGSSGDGGNTGGDNGSSGDDENTGGDDGNNGGGSSGGNNGGSDTETPDTDTEIHTFAQQVAALVNEERAKAGLEALTLDTGITSAAQVRAHEIETSFAHTRPNGTSFSTALTEAGISYRGAGENIAWGQRTPEEVMNGWMNSEGHKANILNPSFTKIGVGYYQNASGRNYWTQLFTY